MREGPPSSSEAAAQDNVTPRRLCPFCDAPFTDRMQAWMGESVGCACCGGRVMGHWPIKAPDHEAPDHEVLRRDTPELVCDACGKVLYRAP
jgi:hypothetical protein